MNMEYKLKVTEIQRFCMHDGPGVRTTVFFKGCPLRCKWCHNPETQKNNSELLFYPNKCIYCGGCVVRCKSLAHSINEQHTIDREKCSSCFECTEICPAKAIEKCGNDLSIEKIMSVIERDRAFYGQNGGITLSGGEPFMQGEAVVELLKVCHESGMSTAVETSGYADTNLLVKACGFVDLFLWDIKDTDEERHKKYTGVSNCRILENLRVVNDLGSKIRLRCILVNGVNTEIKHYKALAELAKGIKNSDGLEIIPYHAYGGTKSEFLGLSDNGKNEWIPTEEQIFEAENVIRAEGIKVL